jgi:hypothetical protein
MGCGNDDLKRLADDMKRMYDKMDEHHTEVKTWRQEDLVQTTNLAPTVETLAGKIQALTARVAQLEGTRPHQDPAVVNSTMPQQSPLPNPTAPPPNPPEQPSNPAGSGVSAGGQQPFLAGKGILNVDGVLHHGSGLFPKKPFDEVLHLKTAHSSTSGSGSSTDMVPRYFRLDFPCYDGKEDPLPWLSRCEQFFHAQQTEPQQKLWLATFHLDGDTFHWYAHLERSRGMPSWEEFHELCNVRFGPPIHSNPLGELRLLRQIGTVADYISRFLALLSRVDPLSDRQEQQMLPADLSDDIRVDVELMGPATWSVRAPWPVHTRRRQCAPNTVRSAGYRQFQQPRPPLNPAPASNTAPARQIRRLTPAEMAERRRQGLCFNCDEPFVRGHKCAHLFYIEYDDSITDDVTSGDDTHGDDEPRISLYVVAGVQAEDTVRLRIFVKGQELLALVDFGFSHNFIRDEVVVQLGVALLPVRAGLNVVVANGDRLPCQGFCEGLDIVVGVEPFRLPCFSLALGGYDLILGTQWLRTLGPILWDFSRLSMTCFIDGRRVTWQGEPRGSLTSCRQLQTQEMLEHLLHEFADLFVAPSGLPPARPHDHHIHLEHGAQPVAVRPYRYPQLQKDELEQQCADMLRQRIIRLSTSAFSSPVLLVKKVDGSWRFCVDYRALNAVTIKDKFPIPVVEELLDELHGARFFSKLDLRSGYHQVRMFVGDVEKTALRTHQGHYEFLVMPFGLANAPATFQALMNDILGRYLRQFVLVFFDDILIYSSSWTEHLHHVHLVLNTLRQHQLCLKKTKCAFGVPTVSYLGHVLSATGVAMDSQKVQAVADWARPRTVRALRGFIGLAGYYRRFIQGYGAIAAPLTRLLTKDGFTWGDEAENPFQELKRALSSASVLQLPNFERSFVVECDASGSGMGAMLH